MIEQIVAANGEAFIGTWWSTFTGYINRMRGYMGRILAKPKETIGSLWWWRW
jgi:hypothetical protein